MSIIRNVDMYGVGVPSTFTRMTENATTTQLQKGQLNKIRMIPKILNEHAESSREEQGIVTSSNIVGQVFKASHDSITSLGLTLESAAGVQLDNFESYANSAALQAVWVASGNLALLETTIVKPNGSKSMNIPGDTLNDEWIMTISSTDYTDYVGDFDAYFDKEYNKFKVAVFIGDGTNTKSQNLVFANKNEWNHFQIDEGAMSEDGGGTTNVAAITKVGFRIVDKEGGKNCYIDNLTATPPPGEIEIKLWDMGASIPVSTTTSIDDGTQYTQIGDAEAASYTLQLKGGKRLYNIHEFHCGADKAVPTTTLLTAGNYYILELKYIDTDTSVYGPNTAYSINYYASGYAFTAPDEATAITAIGTYSDCMFQIFSRQEIYIKKVEWKFNAVPNGLSDISVFLEDTNMGISDIIIDHEEQPAQIEEEDVSDRPMVLEDGGKLEFYYNDDYTDSVSQLQTEMTYYFEPPEANG